MDLKDESTAAEIQLTDYEIERNKPMPTLLHGALQANFLFELKLKYGNKFRLASEVSLDIPPKWSTPDVVAYPISPLDYKDDPVRRKDAPLLAIEIQSPSQSSKDMTDKLEQYFYFGVKSCWIVTPDFKAVLVYDNPFHYRFYQQNEILVDGTLGIEIDLKKVFE